MRNEDVKHRVELRLDHPQRAPVCSSKCIDRAVQAAFARCG